MEARIESTAETAAPIRIVIFGVVYW